MYWLQRPPYSRWAASVLIVLAALAWDLRSAATEPYPVAAQAISVGTPLGSAEVDWVELPVGRLPVPDLTGAVAARDLSPGEPLTHAVIAGVVEVPEDWWTIPVEIGELAVPGDEVLLIVADPPISAAGIVVAAQTADSYSLAYRPAAVAVPPESAPVVAAAEREGLLITAIRSNPGRG